MLASLVFLAALGSPADDGTRSAAEAVDYVRHVKPLLAKHCVSCHGSIKPRAGLRLDTARSALQGGTSGPAIVAGHAEESPLIEALLGTGGGERMPLKREPLSEQEIQLLRTWINQGAKAPSQETPTPSPTQHWAFLPPRRPTTPHLRDRSRIRNPIDVFVQASQERVGLSPSPEADRVTLARRLSLDLIGLPPTPEEVDRFLCDTRPDAYERLVDRLLASPHFGERWARPWLDLARYADSNGYSIDAPRSIWKYRDWVIEALNTDLPFDQFVADQLAGDLQPNATLAQRTATGFHRNTPINQEGGIDLEQFRVDSVVDRVNTTATAFLGLTVGCAQCHDHKYDPISQAEYYRLFAFFNSVDEPEMDFDTPTEKAARGEIEKQIAAFHKRIGREHPEIATKERAWEGTLKPEFKQALPPQLKDAFDRAIEKRTEAQWQGLTELFLSQSLDYRDLHAELAGLRSRVPRRVTTMVVRERPSPRPTFVHVMGDFTRKGDPVQPDVPEILPRLPRASHATLNRLDLARWLTQPGHPLTARVTVNRLWQAYFGRGLVETENDFGTQGTPPSHPELLDWLACEFAESGWGVKALHRLIVTSATYRQASTHRPELDRIDPTNRWLARQSRLRLDAELIRDSALRVSGLFAPAIGGPSVYPPQPEGVMSLGQVRRPWIVSEGQDRYRRGLYTFFWRATPHPSLTVFDAPNAVQACTRRPRSNTPLQALTLLNDEGYFECAQALGSRILRDAPPDDRERAERLFRVCLGREPRNGEVDLLVTLVKAESEAARSEGQRSETEIQRMAWTSAARVVLNLDEFITRE
ncbi:MAG: DUF1553 domain-containing protein [Isosphaeraceae bacterium]